MPVIEVNGLSKEFRFLEKKPGLAGSLRSLFKSEYKSILAVDSVNFSVDAGEMLAFIGPNGAGKSTTIKMLTGILYPSSGSASVLGLVPWKQREKLAFKIGSVFGQKSQLWYHLPAIDSFELLSKIYEIPKNDYENRLDFLVEAFNANTFLCQPVRKLSLGQRMRCELIASLLHSPKVLFLDEPTIGMDIVAKKQLREEIKRINSEEKTTIFLTSHDVGDVEQLCERIIIINQGKIVLDTSVEELKKGFLNKKIIELKFEEPVKDFKIDGATIVKKSKDNFGAKMELDIKKKPLKRAIKEIVSSYAIEDITISEMPIEEIIMQIYARK